nr:TetR/AcrR family transcriptional regulator [Pseudoxanthomonas sp.]
MPKVIDDEKIYDAVMQTIIERGYAGATTKLLADAANMSEVTLFRKFGSKSELVKRAIQALVERTDFKSATKYTGDIQADLMRVLQAYQGSVVMHEKFFASLFSEISRNPELVGSFSQPLALFRSIGELLTRYQKDGLLRKEHPSHAVASLLGPLIYTAMMRGPMPENAVPPIDLEEHISKYLEGRKIYK